MRNHRLVAFLALVPLLFGDYARSANDSQQYQVNVPTRLFITAPVIDPIRGYPGSGSADIDFAPQTWRARSNSLQGATVTLETTTAFRHTVTTTSKRNARLDLSVRQTYGPGLWTILIPTATTNYSAGNEQARVRVTTNGPGSANLYLIVTFLTGAPGSLRSGDYQTTVVGTITEI